MKQGKNTEQTIPIQPLAPGQERLLGGNAPGVACAAAERMHPPGRYPRVCRIDAFLGLRQMLMGTEGTAQGNK